MGRDRADRVVDPDSLDEEDASGRRSTPATKPITIAAQGATNAQAAVIATSAATAPFSIIDRSGFLITSQDASTAPSTPAAAARFVFHRDVGEEADAAEVDAEGGRARS